MMGRSARVEQQARVRARARRVEFDADRARRDKRIESGHYGPQTDFDQDRLAELVLPREYPA